MASERDGPRNTAMFDALTASLQQSGFDAVFEETVFGSTFEPRPAPAEGFRISYHSCGDVRHVWRLKETSIPWFYSFDRLGFSGWSEISVRAESYREGVSAEDEASADAFCTTLVEWLDSGNLSKYRQDSGDLPIDVPFVFFPLQIRDDVVARFARIDPLLALRKAARMAKAAKVPMVIKRHPYCTSRSVGAAISMARLANPYVFVSNGSVNSLLSKCGSVLVANSGVGLEALLRGKKVHSFAAGEYDLASHAINSPDGLYRAFDLSGDGASSLATRFASYYLRRMCFDARDPASIVRQLDMARSAAANDHWCERAR
jgi:hypothetical protein